ncbi:efflux transporter, RND family, MFP subunit [Pseudopedobacter saltans DSM 12145]|uniref:Efflux transporter, RND family, MFP subunit n=1 Tax=Pseudopedobacter saltans (strain ATCC 51119 / DSM 12145 / JCM 21818 / CCUG 39354 / LMG 10337 / NBRC 100064 / NCIMB 13643) TaxID=762903 RepID=F0SER9_PSESL|nr:efflux RND transporter periplasmic adaptor subunit [Pseudopedobacter saltans]ADY52985.1 efflux transporter, RND family, MFP subunit [Pseudopedobacter saltans DSM 12145]
MSKKLKRILIIGGVLVVLLIIATKAGWIGKSKAIKVAVSKVETKDIIETVSASGKIQPEVQVKLSPEVSGEIVELNVREGDIVKKGQLLCKIKPDILVSGYDRSVASYNAQKAAVGSAQQQIVQAEANFKNVEARFKRNQTLYKDKVISASEFDAAQAEYLTAKANLESAKQGLVGAKFNLEQSGAAVKEASDNLARTNIYAPVDGVVSKLSVEKGERVVGTAQMSGTEIMTIADLSSMEVNVEVNENDINRLSLGDTSIIEVDAFMGRKFKGVVTEIASSANIVGESVDQVTNFAVKVKILPESYMDVAQKNKLPSPFRPGLSATVDIQTNRSRGMVVPIQAVTARENENTDNNKAKEGDKQKAKTKEYVFIVDGNKAKQQEVKTGIQDNQYIIVEGLKANQEVISAPYSAISKDLKDGAEIEVVDKSKLFSDVKK